MIRSNYLIKDYEHMVNGRVLCKEHGLIRCSECAHVDDLEKQNKRYRKALEKISAPIDKVTYAYMFAVKQIARQVKHWRVKNDR